MKPVRWTVGRDQTLATAEQILVHRRLRQLFVVDAGKLVGSISEGDILRYRAKVKPDETWWRDPIWRAMQDIALVAGPDDLTAEAGDRLAASRVDVMPIVERGYLVGQITARDLLEVELRGRPEAQPVTAADLMSEPAVTVTPDDSLLVAAGIMAEHQLRHLPVIGAGLVVGILSDRDVRTAVGDPVRFITGPETARLITVRDAMTGPAVTVAAHTPLAELAAEFADDKIGALPVVDRERKLLGVVSYVDVLRALAERK